MAKRYLDVAIAALVLAALAPLLLVIAALVRLEDGGSVLFTQTRVGRGGRLYRIYKFRTMRDGWITAMGAWLRATGLDELPQLANVLRGDMSFIGPRPLTPADVARLGWDGGAHALRWRVRPGITGLAQLFAGSGARLSWFLDRRYVLARSFGLDLSIVLVSAAMMLGGKRRVRRWLRGFRDANRSHRRLRAPAARRNFATSLPSSSATARRAASF